MDYKFLLRCDLFQGMEEADIQAMLQCLQASMRRFRKGEILFHAGSVTDCAGLVLSGGVYLEQSDVWGNQNMLSHAGPGDLFAEAYACIGGEPLMVSVIAAQDTSALFVNTKRILQVCSSACPFHTRLIQNLLSVLSRKNLSLTRKITHTASKSIRGRVLSYLSFQAQQEGACSFNIPFNRQQMADYLCVDRSALSYELSKMQEEGVLSFSKNRFILHTVTPFLDH